jgi:hypothetical protein
VKRKIVQFGFYTVADPSIVTFPYQENFDGAFPPVVIG